MPRSLSFLGSPPVLCATSCHCLSPALTLHAVLSYLLLLLHPNARPHQTNVTPLLLVAGPGAQVDSRGNVQSTHQDRFHALHGIRAGEMVNVSAERE